MAWYILYIYSWSLTDWVIFSLSTNRITHKGEPLSLLCQPVHSASLVPLAISGARYNKVVDSTCGVLYSTQYSKERTAFQQSLFPFLFFLLLPFSFLFHTCGAEYTKEQSRPCPPYRLKNGPEMERSHSLLSGMAGGSGRKKSVVVTWPRKKKLRGKRNTLFTVKIAVYIPVVVTYYTANCYWNDFKKAWVYLN